MKKEYVVELSEEEADELMNEHWVGELVRCKDCMHYDRDENSELGTCLVNGVCSTQDWFCADGEASE